MAGLSMADPPPKSSDVGDADSFAKGAIWIGLAATGGVSLTSDCTPDPAHPPGPDDRCVVLKPSPASTPFFSFPDLGRITLPGNTVGSVICHWATPSNSYTFNNPTASSVVAQFRAHATYRMESEVLKDPSLIDPHTGLPFGGGIDTGIGGVTDIQSIAPGATRTHSYNATRTCIEGLISKVILTRDYGLTQKQARTPFQKPFTIRVGSAGTVSWVSDAGVYYSSRSTGDQK